LTISEANFTFVKSFHSQREKQASLSLVRQSFGPETDQGYEDYYEWQYLQNPVGQGMVLLVYDGEKAIAQQGLIPCKYQVFGNHATVFLTMNACVSPEYRRKGLMTEMKRRIHQHYPDTALFLGVPGPANSSSKRNHYYSMPLTLLIRPLRISNYFHNHLKSLLKPFDKIWSYDRNSRCQDLSLFDERFDDFARVTYNDQTIRQVRDSSFLNWRYITNPRKKYNIFMVTDPNGNLEGYIVLRITKIGRIKVGLIMDFVCKYNKFVSGRSLISNALEFFWSEEVVFASICCFPNNFEYRLLRKTGFYKCPSFFRPHPLTLWIKSFNQDKIDPSKVYDLNKWFFMLGDYETF
jgi:Acetyltransferase (GNAT) domain